MPRQQRNAWVNKPAMSEKMASGSVKYSRAWLRMAPEFRTHGLRNLIIRYMIARVFHDIHFHQIPGLP